MSDSRTVQLRWRGKVSGPYTRQRILEMLDAHEIGMLWEVEVEGRWISLQEFLAADKPAPVAVPTRAVATLKPAAIAPPPEAAIALPPPLSPKPASDSPEFEETPPIDPAPIPTKRRAVFAVLGLALGYIGVHNLYAGYRGTAALQFVLTLATLALGLGFFATWIWAMLELVLVDTDRRGVRMT